MSTERVRYEEFSENLARIFEKVLLGYEVVVEREKGEVVTLKPGAPDESRRRHKTEKNLEAFRAAAGSWSDLDTDQLIRDIYESRERSSRPAVEL